MGLPLIHLYRWTCHILSQFLFTTPFFQSNVQRLTEERQAVKVLFQTVTDSSYLLDCPQGILPQQPLKTRIENVTCKGTGPRTVECLLHLGTTYALSREAIITLRACLEASEAMSTPAHPLQEGTFVALHQGSQRPEGPNKSSTPSHEFP